VARRTAGAAPGRPRRAREPGTRHDRTRQHPIRPTTYALVADDLDIDELDALVLESERRLEPSAVNGRRGRGSRARRGRLGPRRQFVGPQRVDKGIDADVLAARDRESREERARFATSEGRALDAVDGEPSDQAHVHPAIMPTLRPDEFSRLLRPARRVANDPYRSFVAPGLDCATAV